MCSSDLVPMVPRVCGEGLRVGGYDLPAGTTVAAAIYNAHMHADPFEDPLSFRPERFLDRSYGPFEYLPWGGGHRRCLGASFAQFELAVTLGTLLESGTFTLDEAGPVGNAFRVGTYGPSTGVRMTRQA